MEITAWDQEHCVYPHMQVKALSGKEEATCEHDPETPLLCGYTETKFEILYRKHELKRRETIWLVQRSV